MPEWGPITAFSLGASASPASNVEGSKLKSPSVVSRKASKSKLSRISGLLRSMWNGGLDSSCGKAVWIRSR